MPPGKHNPPHMHFTAEVFMCVHGRWDLQWGFNPGVLKAGIGPGDIASVPTWIYRGFQNTGDVEGFMFTALGRDDTGGVLWGPDTLEAARAQGVHLTEDYRIIDEQAGQTWNDATDRRLQPMTPAEIGELRVWSAEQMARRVVRFADLAWSSNALLDARLPGCGAQMAPVIGLGMSQDRNHEAPVINSHGFSIEWLRIPPGGSVSRHGLREKQVLVVYQGQVEIEVESDEGMTSMSLRGQPDIWDTYAMPADCWRSYRNRGDGDALVIVMSAGDGRKMIEWPASTLQAAGDRDVGVDANGYVAPRRFTDRAQR
jgi:mannose-6-phosphate isomerase-like protein (cupin superfamily)